MLGTIVFLIIALIAVVAAIGLLTSTNAVHAALFLVINFTCIALFYLGLNAPFLAMVQITVYAGAIMVLFLFVIMLLGAESVQLGSTLRWQAPLAIVLVVALIVVSAFVLLSQQVSISLPSVAPISADSLAVDSTYSFGSAQAVGEVLFNRYLLPFEMTGVLLLVALVGAVVLARDEAGRTIHNFQTGQEESADPEGSAAD
jgi:NADH-quinone oxidoreductase subunit J